jgi:hypothetical protein
MVPASVLIFKAENHDRIVAKKQNLRINSFYGFPGQVLEFSNALRNALLWHSLFLRRAGKRRMIPLRGALGKR